MKTPPPRARVRASLVSLAIGAAVFGAMLIGHRYQAVTLADAREGPATAVSAASPLVVGHGIPARNPTTLSLVVDHRKVLGWISGTRDYAGQEVKITAEGKSESVVVQEGNTFTWHYRLTAPTQATFAVDNMTQTATLEPVTPLAPTAFFVLDRSVYRPGHELKFAGFLRKLDDRGEFVPQPNTSVEVAVVSDRKKTTAARLKLTSDDMGRIEGNYRWSDADAIDDYTIAITGYKGEAKVSLAEYRKSKIKLKIAGKVEREKLTLTFDALDFLEKPVPGSKVSFVAQIVQNSQKKASWTLKGDEFAYHTKAWLPIPDMEDLSEEEALLSEAESAFLPPMGAGGKTVVSQVSQEVQLDSGTGTHTIDLRKDWLGGRFSVDVQGVLIDANGREQRAAHVVDLNETKQRLALSLPKRTFAANEPIVLQALATDEKGAALQGSSTVVAMKLSPGQVMYHDPAAMGYPAYMRRSAYRRQVAMQMGTIQRTLATAAPFQGDKAEIKLSEPGAYKLVVVTRSADGKSLTDEVGCVVRDPDELPGLLLTTNKREYASGETIEAEIQSRFTGAHALLTLRDSAGVRLWKPLQLAGQKEKIRVRLPDDLRYGTDLAIQYVEGNGKVHVANQFVRVVPEHRFLTIKTDHKEQVSPGDNVKLKLTVNRAEPVDLVVSVYDQSLLGVSSDKQVDAKNFYFADERVTLERDRDVLRRRLGHLTLGAAVEQAEAQIKEREKSSELADLQAVAALKTAVQQARSGYLNAYHLATLLQACGVTAHFRHNYYYADGYSVHTPWANAGATRMADLVDRKAPGEWRIAYRFFNDALLMMSVHPSHENQPYIYAWNGGQYWNDLDQLAAKGSGRPQALYERGNFRARGDGAFSISGNGSFSVEGQAAISHMPAVGMAALAPMDMGGTGGETVGAVRRDFSDAAFWNSRVRTDARGEATVDFKLPDSLTNWQVVVTAVTKDMHVGSARSKFRTFKPVMVWPMLPRNFTQGDKVALFGTVHNHTDKPQKIRTTIKIDNGELVNSPATVEVLVKPKGNEAVYWTYKAAKTGYAQILMSADCAEGSDASLKRLPVIDASVWEASTKSGFCKGDVNFTVPAGVDLSTAMLEVSVAPSLAADMAETLDYLVDYPHGCVEQTMSRFLPAIKVAQILTKFQIKNPGLEQKLPKCVDMGMKRLLELQQSDGGWGWNGNGQTHEMMTPYALYGLLEAEKAGYKIPNEQAVQRGLARLRAFIDGMGSGQTSDRLYCMYVYSNREKLQDAWWTFISDELAAKRLSDYATAMALEMAAKENKEQLATKLAASLRQRAVRATGTAHWTTAKFSRWGDDRHEITAAVLKAFAAHDVQDPLVSDILSYFAQTKRGNRWNSTKDTAMILYAMCDYLAKQHYDLKGEKTTSLAVNSAARKTTIRIDNGLTQKVTFSADDLKPGENTLHFVDASPEMMYRLNLKYRQSGGNIRPAANGINVTRSFWLLNDQGHALRQLKDGETIAKGAYIMSTVAANSSLGNEMRYVLVENPKPGSCEIQPVEDRRFPQSASSHVLREDKEIGVFWHHEQLNGSLQNSCVLRAEMSGEFVIAPASVELMYKPETRGHSGTFHLTVKDEAKVATK